MQGCPKCGCLDVMGHEVRGVYDGVLYWSCLACRWAWARDWSGFGTRRQEIAGEHAATWNTARAGEIA